MTNRKLFNLLISIFFILCHLHNFSNKGYVVLLSFFLVSSYLINKNLIVSLWHIFLTILPFERGRYFLTFVVEKEFWGGGFPINIEYLIKYSDLLIVCILGLFIRARFILSQPVIFLRKFPKKELLVLCAFLFTAAFSTLNATFTVFAFYQYFTFFILILVFFISCLIEKYTQENNLTISILLLHSCIMCFLLLSQFKNGSQLGIQLEHISEENPFGSIQVEAQNRYRPGGYFFDPNAAAIWLLMSVPLIILHIEKAEKKALLTLFHLTILTLFLVGIIITSSRFIWIVTGLLFLAYLIQKKYRTLSMKLAETHKKIFVISLCIFAMFLPLVISRLSNFSYTFREGGGIDYRLSHYLLSFDFVLNYPLGIGLGMFKYEILGNFSPDRFSHDPTYPHNILVEVAVGSGFFGLILFCLFLLLNFHRQFIQWRLHTSPYLFAVFLSSLCYIVGSQAYPYLLRSPIAEFFWIIMGLSVLNSTKNKKNEIFN